MPSSVKWRYNNICLAMAAVRIGDHAHVEQVITKQEALLSQNRFKECIT